MQVVIGHEPPEGKGPIFTTPRACIIQPINTKLGTFENLVHTTDLDNFGHDQL
jgi:hypothetical protein